MISKTTILHDSKNLTRALPTCRYVDPDYVYLPVTNTRCPQGELYVKEGDYVKVGQVIGLRKAAFFEQPIHSTVSGTIVGMVKKFHRSGKLLDCVQIKNDKLDTLDENCKERTQEEIDALTQEDYIKIAKDNSLVGLGGSGFPTYIKLQTKEKIDIVMLNGIECEPYLTSDYRLMLEFPDRIMKGLIYAMKAVHAPKGMICIKSKYHAVNEVLNQVKKKYSDYDIEVKCVGNYYPQGWELEMIYQATGIRVPQGTLPAKFGILNFNVSTIVGFYKAVKYNMPVIKRMFTVTGDGIKYPQNFRIRVGTSLLDLIEKCGGYTDDSDKVLILGGPMMGNSFVRDDIITSKTSTSAIILNKEERKEEPCVRCASCVYSCPCNLQPVQIMNAVKRKDLDALKAFNVKKCIECGLCAYSCTSKIHVTDYVRQAKRMVK